MHYTLRPYQIQARDEILAAYHDGCTDVYLDAPTGSGKTIIAHAVSKALPSPALYVPADKLLQRQFEDTFPNVPTLMGHGNYCGEDVDLHTQIDTRLDCGCTYWDKDLEVRLPYEWSPSGYVTHMVRKHDDTPDDRSLRKLCLHACRRLIAAAAPLANLNPWKYLYELPRWFQDRAFVVIDEADSLSGSVDDYFDTTISLGLLKNYDWFEPPKNATTPDLLNALRTCHRSASAQLQATLQDLEEHSDYPRKTVEDLGKKMWRLRRDRDTITKFGTQAAAMHNDHENAVMFWDAQDLTLRLVSPGRALAQHAWSQSERRLHMTGSFGADPLHWAEHMGLPTTPDLARVIRVPHQFPVENRLVTVAPVAEMSYRAWSDPDIVRRMAREIDRLHTAHGRPRTLVHVTSRAQADALRAHLPAAITYTKRGENREKAVAELGRRPHAILIAHSCHRGVDLKDDLCRLNIVAKLPFGMLDRSTKARQQADPNYYSWEVAAKLVQSLGRAVRGPEDWAHSYILDAAFSMDSWSGRQVIKQLPPWIGEALRP